MPQTNLILLTGATGFIGFRTLIFALQEGYSVRCVIRDPKKSSAILSNPAIKALNLIQDALTFATVPDLTVEGAYESAIQDVTHVIHVASPLPAANPSGFETAEESFIKPAVRGALEMLEAAQRTSTVRRVVVTSSVVALVPGPVFAGVEPSNGAVYGPTSRLPTPKGPFLTNAQAYAASKIAQLNAVEDWVRRHRPSFSVSTTHPSWVLGRNDLASSLEGLWASTNRFALDIAIGKSLEDRRAGVCVHVDDVARAHVLALNERIEGNRSLVLSSPMLWEDVPKILEKHFPAALKAGTLSLEGRQATARMDIKGDETEKLLGFRYLNFEEQVKSIVAQYLELKRSQGTQVPEVSW